MSGFIGRLWRGDRSLATAFWIFYVIGYVVCALLVATLSPAIAAQPWRLLSVLALMVPYMVLATVGVTRSAARHPGARAWAVLALVVVGLWDVWLAFSLTVGAANAIAEWGIFAG